MRRAAFVLALALAAAPLRAGPAEQAAAALALLDEATEALSEAGSGRDRVAALTETITAVEGGLDAVRAGMRQAAIREQALTGRLAAKEAEVAELRRLLATLTTGRRRAPPAVTSR